MKKRSPFILAALEELSQEAGQDVSAVDSTPASAPGTNAPALTQTDINSDTDAVAELMEKNSTLATENAELESECFDNDTDVIDSASDSVNQDLEEAVQAGIALEQLSHLAALTVKSGQANTASVAALAFGLEQITDRLHLPSQMAALEAEDEGEPEAQAKSIGEKAKGLAASIGKKLVEGMKKIAKMAMTFIENLFTNTKMLSEKAKVLHTGTYDLPNQGEITDAAFIKRLRLTDDDDDVHQQFGMYFEAMHNTFFAFFNDKFVKMLEGIVKSIERKDAQPAGSGQLFVDLVNAMYEHMFILEPKGKIPGVRSEKANVMLTPSFIGGLQLFMAIDESVPANDPKHFQIGVAPEPKLKTPSSIPTCTKELANDVFPNITKQLAEFRDLQKTLHRIEALSQGATRNYGVISVTTTSTLLKLFSSMALNILPHMLNLSVRNSKNFIAYVEKSLAVAKAENRTS